MVDRYMEVELINNSFMEKNHLTFHDWMTDMMKVQINVLLHDNYNKDTFTFGVNINRPYSFLDNFKKNRYF